MNTTTATKTVTEIEAEITELKAKQAKIKNYLSREWSGVELEIRLLGEDLRVAERLLAEQA